MVTGDRSSAVHARPQLYDALVALEAAGAATVVQRGLALSTPADIVLSAASCLCVWTEAQLQVS